MNITELYHLTTWIDKEVRTPNVVAKYTALQQGLQRYTQRNQQAQSFETQKVQLIEAIKDIPIFVLSKDQYSFLDSLGIASAVSSVGVQKIEDTLFRNVIDVATSAQNIQLIINDLNAGLSKSAQIRSGLTDCVEDDSYEDDGEVLLRVAFQGDASIDNVADFKQWGKRWYDIGRGIALAHKQSPEDIKVVGASKGSVIIVLSVAATIAGTTSYIILQGLKVAEKVLDLRMKAEELRGMKIANNQIAKDLEKAADEEKDAGIAQITKDTSKKLKLTKTKNNEEMVALEKAVKDLLGFIEDGGDVDFVPPEVDKEEDLPPELIELQESIESIREIESKMHQIGYDTEGDQQV